MKIPRSLLHLLIGAALVISIRQPFRTDWGEVFGYDRTPLEDFLQTCRREIPEDAPVLLVGNTATPQAATRLYPRPIRLYRTRQEAWQAASNFPGAWIVVVPSPFSRTDSLMLRPGGLH
ncbi:MAG TPA: hypothetical protein VK661_02760 [Planctomycetota bacterium]|nr:hypothetical protein [Planctomycetota bacterium]